MGQAHLNRGSRASVRAVVKSTTLGFWVSTANNNTNNHSSSNNNNNNCNDSGAVYRREVRVGGRLYMVRISQEAFTRGVLEPEEPIEVRVRPHDGRAVAFLPRRGPYTLLARVLTNAPPGLEADHLNHDPLDCTYANLAIRTRAQNLANRRKPRRRSGGGLPSSRFKGVSWDARRKKWRAEVQAAHRRHFLGLFVAEHDAALAYDAAARRYQGETPSLLSGVAAHQ